MKRTQIEKAIADTNAFFFYFSPECLVALAEGSTVPTNWCIFYPETQEG